MSPEWRLKAGSEVVKMLSRILRIFISLTFFLPLGFFLCPPAAGSPIASTWVHATVRIENEWGRGGTGFLIIRKMNDKQGKVFLITNKHVLHLDPQMRRDASFLKMFVNVREKDGAVHGTVFQFSLSEEGHRLWREHPTPDVDVLAIDVTALINSHPGLENKGADYSFFALPEVLKREEITEGEEVLVIGYPLGLYHSRTHSPLVRQGIIATKIGERINIRIRQPSGESRRVEIPGFLIDAAIVPGSSGSPVVLKPIVGRKVRDQIAMETAKPYLLGIVSATETAAIRVESTLFPTLAGLGIVFDVETILQTIELFFKKE
jgi:V8-like Glu-specific endopeptidase